MGRRISRNKPESYRGLPSPGSDKYRQILIAVFVTVTIIVAVFPVTIVTVMFTVFVPFPIFAAIPLTIVPLITVMLVPFAIVSARYGNGKLLR
jgi:archaellum biogenesis protein FlaJ (TadC family)